jgi:hypothetical protein
VLWFGQAGGRFAGRAVTVNGTYQPFTGDFDGDVRRDIFCTGRAAATTCSGTAGRTGGSVPPR